MYSILNQLDKKAEIFRQILKEIPSEFAREILGKATFEICQENYGLPRQ